MKDNAAFLHCKKNFTMPANLNALIRYKTINSALYGGNRRWSVPELAEKCSDALAEYRGRYEGVSERTIRDDIRVMRSDILGYNAPIAQQKGLYYYSDKGYSIMTISFTDSGLVERIIRFLGEIKPEIAHPELEIIMEKLKMLRTSPNEIEQLHESMMMDESDKSEEPSVASKIRSAVKLPYPMMQEPLYPGLITWGDLFLLIKY
jgi:predicted DNA-binding transcriptional regulator YafY